MSKIETRLRTELADMSRDELIEMVITGDIVSRVYAEASRDLETCLEKVYRMVDRPVVPFRHIRQMIVDEIGTYIIQDAEVAEWEKRTAPTGEEE